MPSLPTVPIGRWMERNNHNDSNDTCYHNLYYSSKRPAIDSIVANDAYLSRGAIGTCLPLRLVQSMRTTSSEMQEAR
jgi:hypothetical protein